MSVVDRRRNLKIMSASALAGKGADFSPQGTDRGRQPRHRQLWLSQPHSALRRSSPYAAGRAASYRRGIVYRERRDSLRLESLLRAALSAHLSKARMDAFGEAPVSRIWPRRRTNTLRSRTILSGGFPLPPTTPPPLSSASRKCKGDLMYNIALSGSRLGSGFKPCLETVCGRECRGAARRSATRKLRDHLYTEKLPPN